MCLRLCYYKKKQVRTLLLDVHCALSVDLQPNKKLSKTYQNLHCNYERKFYLKKLISSMKKFEYT